MSGPIWAADAATRLLPASVAVSARDARVRTRVRELTPRARCHEDLRTVIADVNRVLRGLGQYFRTGNAAMKFIQIDTYVEERLRGLLRQAGGLAAPRRPCR